MVRIILGSCSILATGHESFSARRIGEAVGHLRQIADEMLDLVEDTRDGLITIPTLYALAINHGSKAVAGAVRAVAGAAHCEAAETRLREVVIRSGACERIRNRAEIDFLSAAILSPDLPKPEFALALLVQRKLQIERAEDQGLTDARGGLTIDELLTCDNVADWREIVGLECSISELEGVLP